MILTGRAKQDFGMFLVNKNKIADWETFYKLPIVCQYALIIDWFDSDDIINFQDLYMSEFKNWFLMYPISSIQKEAIIKSNEIYNNLNQ